VHPTSTCETPETHSDNARYVARLHALRKQRGGAPLLVVHMNRFDIVADTLAQLPGFRADFLVPTDRPWSEVMDFFARDHSPRCGSEGCRWSDAWGAREEDEKKKWLASAIDRSGGPGRHESVVYYLVRAEQVQRLFWPTAALADLRNPEYRAWRVAEAKRAMEQGGYDAISLNHKFHQFRYEPQWIGSRTIPDVATLRAKGDDTYWTAPPRDYGYPEFVAGWAALGADLRAAGIPYEVEIPIWPWIETDADDPSTPADEGKMITEVARGARVAILDANQRRRPPRFFAYAEDLRKHGVTVVITDFSCGYGHL